MKSLSPDERRILERAVARELWESVEEEWPIILDLHRRGLLGKCLYRREGYEEPWVSFPAIPESALALRVDAAYRESGIK